MSTAIPPSELRVLGKALSLLRLQTGRKQHEVAAAAKITKAMLSGYETGKNLPSLATLMSLLDALDADFSDLQRALDALRDGPQQKSTGPAVTRKQRGAFLLPKKLEKNLHEIGKAVLEIAASLRAEE